MHKQTKATSNSIVRFRRCATSNCMLAEKKVSSPAVPPQTMLRECKALQQLSGSIAPKFLQLKEGEGVLYLTMEMVEGNLLTDVLQDASRTKENNLQISLKLIKTVEYLHSSGIAHLDLAPSNIFVSEAGTFGIVLIDFVNCAFADEVPFGRPQNSFTGHWSYAAPEQFGLASDQITYSADLYSIALIIRELYGYKDHLSSNHESALEFRKHLLDISRIPSALQETVKRFLRIDQKNRRPLISRNDHNN